VKNTFYSKVITVFTSRTLKGSYCLFACHMVRSVAIDKQTSKAGHAGGLLLRIVYRRQFVHDVAGNGSFARGPRAPQINSHSMMGGSQK
jgi:hypothetical protein